MAAPEDSASPASESLDTIKPMAGEERVVSKTGGQKGKKPEEYALIPVRALRHLARIYGMGARKYAKNNWRNGYEWSLAYSALQRHLNAFWDGEYLDPESELPHLAHAIFHAMSLIEWSEDPKMAEFDDRWKS